MALSQCWRLIRLGHWPKGPPKRPQGGRKNALSGRRRPASWPPQIFFFFPLPFCQRVFWFLGGWPGEGVVTQQLLYLFKEGLASQLSSA